MTTTDVERPRADPDETIEIDPRIQERRTEVRRALGRRRLRALLVAASALVVAGLAVLTLHSPFLDVDHVRITGTQQLTTRQILAAAGVHRGDALWYVDADAAARGIERLPRVRSATVQRDFPSTVRIAIREYTPVAFVRAGAQYVLIADDGRAIARVAAPPPGVKEIVGTRRAPVVRELLSPPDAAGVIAQLPAELAPHVVSLDVGGDGLALHLADDDLTHGGELRLGNADDVAAKTAAALAVLHKRGDTHFVYIDVSTASMPTILEQ